MCGVINTSETNGQNTYRQIQSSDSAILLKGCIYVCVVYMVPIIDKHYFPIMDKTPTHALFTQHYIPLAC